MADDSAEPGAAASALATLQASTSSAEDRIVAFGDYFSNACERGELDPLPSADETMRSAAQGFAAEGAESVPIAPAPGPRILALRDRLARLGYPASKPVTSADAWDLPLQSTVLIFQEEALLPGHGVLDTVTWDALQALFNFETPLRAARWFVAETGEPCPALVRATTLRLSALGCGEAPKTQASPPAPPLAALHHFRWVAHVTGASPHSPPEKPEPLTPVQAELLFDHDGMVERLAEAGTTFDREALSKNDRRGTDHFLVCVAKIELWLQGYDVSPNGKSALVQVQHHGPAGKGFAPSITHDTSTAFELRRFLTDVSGEMNVAAIAPSKLPASLPQLFRTAAQLKREPTQVPSQETSAAIVDALTARLAEEPTLWDRLIKRTKALVSALFDGVKRAIRWVAHLVSRTVETVFEQAVNLWRAVRHFASRVAFTVRTAVIAFTSGVAWLFQPTRTSVPAGIMSSLRRADFDFALTIGATLTADGEAEAGKFGRQTELQARRFGFACKVIGLVTRTVASVGLGALGFLPLLLGLARTYSALRETLELFDALPAEVD